MPQHVGRSALAYTLAQAAAGTAATGNHHPFHYYPPFSPRFSDPYVDDPIIGNGLDNVLDAQAPAPGLVEAGLDLTVPLCLNQIGWHLPHMFGAAAPSGDDPYTHVFTSGDREPAGGSYVFVEADKWERAHTVTWSRLEFGIGQEAGRRQIRFSGMASTWDALASTPLGTPSTALALNSVAGGVGCLVRKNGTAVARIMGGSIYYQRPLVPFRPAGNEDRIATAFTPDVGGMLGGNLEMRFLDRTFRDFADSGGADDFEFEFAQGDDSLVIACPAVRFERTKQPSQGEGLRTESWSIRGEQTSGDPCVTATLTNSIAAYAGEA